MRRRSNHKPYLALLVTLFVIITTPTERATQLRSGVIATVGPSWRMLATAKMAVVAPFARIGDLFGRGDNRQQRDAEDRQRLELENQRLRAELNATYDLLAQSQVALPEPVAVIEEAVPARVVYRSPDAWNHALWIDKGSRSNSDPDNPVIAKDSPVVVGCGVVGVIDYVGTTRSRVRLLTDPGLTPSVRSARGVPQHLATAAAVDQVIAALGPDGGEVAAALQQYKESLLSSGGYHYLAKGELAGTSETLWRRRIPLLRGTGFNYDFSDDSGPARDLRSGKVKEDPTSAPIPLIEAGDLLVTTGMDGVYPPGLHVATVTHVATLREGGYYYDIEARPVVGTLPILDTVFILPPQGRAACTTQ